MTPKLGQKIKENPKDITIRARVDSDTVAKLDYLVEKQGSDRSKVIRQGIELQYEKEIKK
jgi:predicted transcriptional regulator